MGAILSAVIALVGAGLLGTGVLSYFRARFARRRVVRGAVRGAPLDGGASRRPRLGVRASVALTVLGAVLVLLPDAFASLVVPAAPAGDDTAATLGALALFFYRVGVGSALALVGLAMALSSAFVVGRVRGATERATDRLVTQVPFLAGREARALAVPVDFPREWPALLALDKQLTRRFLRYDDDLEAAVNFPVMRDYSDPLTRAALDAMLRCDRVRTPAAPAGVRDARRTDYARAVAQFQVALDAAEANAQRLMWSTFTDDERRTLESAAAALDFMRTNTTTPGERASAYARVRQQLDAMSEQEAARRTPNGDAARPHPFHDIHRRADG